MTFLLFANNASTTLAKAVSSTATTATLAAGTGSQFPTPLSGQGFLMTFNDAFTGLLFEIVLVTGISGDIITMVRAQEGTAAQSWSIGDLASNFYTAGTAQSFLQQGQNLPLNNVSATPLTPTGGGILFAQAGALKYIGSNGTVTTIANA